MARTKSKKPGSAQRKLKKEVELAPAKAAEQQPSLEPEPLRRDESTNAPEVLVADDDDEEEKGDVETELERLVFGDSVGFREGLRNFAGNEGTAQNALVTQEEEDDEGGLEGIADSDVGMHAKRERDDPQADCSSALLYGSWTWRTKCT